MTTDGAPFDGRILFPQADYQRRQRIVLTCIITIIITAFELDTNGKIITVLSPLPAGNPGMPGPVKKGNKLLYVAITFDQPITYQELGGEILLESLEVAFAPFLEVDIEIVDLAVSNDDLTLTATVTLAEETVYQILVGPT